MKSQSSPSSVLSWVAVHEWRVALAVMTAALCLSLFGIGNRIDNLGTFVFPETIPFWLLSSILFGVTIAMATVYRGPNHILQVLRVKSPVRRARALWLLFAVGVSTLCSTVIACLDNDAVLTVMTLNTLLFAGIALSVVVLGFPLLAWFVPALLLLLAMGFGFPEHAADNEWYPWASFLSTELTAMRYAISCGVFFSAAVVYVMKVRPLRRTLVAAD